MRGGLFIAMSATGMLAASSLGVDVVHDWDAGGGNWQYWVEDPLGPRLGGRNEPVDWSPVGGYLDSGHIAAPLSQLFETFGAYWPAYMAPPDPVDPVDLTHKTVRVRVSDLGSSSITPHGPVQLFIGEWNSETDFVFFVHDVLIDVGRDTWSETIVLIGGADNWTQLAPGTSLRSPTELYVNPEQWGFTMVGLTQLPSGMIGFDELVIAEVCPCERDQVNGVTVLDLLDFLAEWFAQRGSEVLPGSGADYDFSGEVDVLDLLAYLGCWFPASAPDGVCV